MRGTNRRQVFASSKVALAGPFSQLQQPIKVAASFSLFGKKKKPLDETDSEHSSDEDDVMMSDNTEELKIDLEDSTVAKEIFGSDEEEKAVLELSDNEFDDFEDAAEN